MRTLVMLWSSSGASADHERSMNFVESWASRSTVDAIVAGDWSADAQYELRQRARGGRVLTLPQAQLPSRLGRLQWLRRRGGAFDAAAIDPRPAIVRARRFVAEVPDYDAVFVSGVMTLWMLRPASPSAPLFLDVAVVGARTFDQQLADLRDRSGRPARDILRSLALTARRDRSFRFELRQAASAHLTT
jgi:hypothetical protein